MTTQDTQHDTSRAYPTQEEAALRSAVTKSGLPVIGYEFKMIDSERQGYYFDVAVLLRGDLALIDLEDWRRPERNEAKRLYCRQENIPLLQVQMGQPVDMQAKIEIWQLTQSDRPSAEDDS